jgi:hypothetical protein
MLADASLDVVTMHEQDNVRVLLVWLVSDRWVNPKILSIALRL